MSLKEKYAFDSGRSCVKYFRDGSKILLGGIVGDVFICPGFEETGVDEFDPFNVGDEVLDLAITEDERILVAPRIEPGDKGCNEILAFKFEDGRAESDGTIAKFSAEATCVDVSKNGKFAACGSADMTLQWVDLENYKVKKFEGHKAPLLQIALDPKNEYIISSSCDGTVKVWKIETETCIKTFEKLWPEVNDIVRSKTSAALNWHPQGDFFAIPFEFGVKLISRENFTEQKLNCPSDKFFTSVSFSSNGNHLAAGTLNGEILFFKIDTGAQFCDVKSDEESMICSIDWNPSEMDEIAFIKYDGHWGVVNNFLKSAKSTAKSNQEIPEKTRENTEKKFVDENNMDPDELAAALFDDDDDDDNENSFSIRHIKKETGFLDDDETTNQSVPENNEAKIDDLDAKPLPSEPKPSIQSLDVDIQEPFQPGSTPTHLESRFMVWNSVGIVRSFNSDDENSIDVEFHDASVHHPIHLGNSHGYTMADLSTEAVLMASEADEAEGATVPSKLTCHYFGASGMNREWSLDMPEKEEIMAICCGIGWVAAATDRRNLRIYSTGGLQKEILSLPGPVVALSGHKDKLLVSVTIGMPLPGNQCIGTAVLDVTNHQHDIPNFNPLPLAPRSILSWQGFTDEGIPCIMDSAGFIRMIYKPYGSSWIQVCDSKSIAKGKSDHFFIVGANLQEFTARCLLVKGSRYPATVPKPVVTCLPLRVPLCGTENEKFINEQNYWKAKIITSAIEDPEITSKMEEIETQSLLKLFAHACQLEQEARAMDICKLMTSQGLQLAIKYASRIKRIQLASKISSMAYEKQETEEQEEAEKEMMERQNRKSRMGSPSQASEDLFASQEDDIEMESVANDNPLLAAEARKDIVVAKTFITPTNTSRNPFKKSNTPSSTPSGSRSGLVFDGIAKKDVMKGPGTKSGGFGSKKIDTTPKTSGKTFILNKKPDKENKSSNQPVAKDPTESGKGLMKGFLLWFEENSQRVSEEENLLDDDRLRDKCLEMWQGLSSDNKKAYKTPRLPKRKREADDTQQSTTSKLAKFAAPKA